ncbi:thiamine-binding protein [Synechococcus sp. MEDNS5]|mgnify:FL=1|uniref:MTH1187 family thiamine-binding protein n=1 Tax=Synechococcus sp. MEDNS5 TaxID=1442554 RepID=UPI000B68836B|nr:MTH1187 family thiamine-binding protein [Synechococcus sp. MEDNS5]OUX74552.1 MAG: hypothetical protein CBC50_00745 [Synechococcus sp. TMED90]QNJ06388.1 thiamine-binding protein [Synechococcus sp. MEDNS5]|tara:strand:- start:992 stop:1291 length:300 start_codon:yes stop_codon:yes gene_type:complete
MRVSVDLCLVPLGVGVSLAPYVAVCQEVIEASGLEHQLGPDGTAIEGEWDAVFACVKACHERLHQNGVPRIHATLRVNTRIDREQSFRDKVSSVQRLNR